MNNRTVLIVEDDFDIRDALCELLEGEGLRVLKAENGRDALDTLAAGERPALVLLDLMMPVLNGWQFLDAVCADSALSQIPVVIASAQPAAVPGARQVVRKPYTVQAILEIVGQYCGSPAAPKTQVSVG